MNANQALLAARIELYDELLLETRQFKSKRSRRRLRGVNKAIKKKLRGLTLIDVARRRRRIDDLMGRAYTNCIINQFNQQNPLFDKLPFIEVTS